MAEMRVLIVTHGFPPHGVAGVERVSEQTASGLAAAGCSVSVLTRRPSAAPPVLRIETERRGSFELHTVTGAGSSFGRFPGWETEMERVFERTLAAVVPDVVLLNHLLHHSPSYVDLAHRWGVPVVMELHDFFAACPLAHLRRATGELCAGPEGGRACATHCFREQDAAEARWALRALEFGRALERADAVLAPSRHVADWFERWADGRTTVRVVPNGVSFRAPAGRAVPREPGPLHLASIGVVIEHKGPHIVVEAIRAARLGDVRYTLFGVPVADYVSRLRAVAGDLENLDLRLHGAFSPDELPILLRGVDAVVVGSIVEETFSIVAREALACGIPVIAPARAGLLEAVRPGDNGLLYRPDDPIDLARQLTALQEQPGLADRLRAGIQPEDWMSTDARTRVMLELLKEVCRRPRRRDGSRAAQEWTTRTIRESVASHG